MRSTLCALMLAGLATPASAAQFFYFNLINQNFVRLGDPIDYHVVVAAGSTPALSTSIVDPLPVGLEMVPGTLVCYAPPGSADCTYDAPSRTVSWAGDLAAYEGVDMVFSVTTTGLVGPGYFTNTVTGSATGYTTEQAVHTTVAYVDDEWPILGDLVPLAVTDPSYLMRYAYGVAWSPVAETFLASWNRTDQSSTQEVVVLRTVDPTGALGAIQQVSEVTVAGEMPVWAKIACSSTTAHCLVAWQETQPPEWHSGVHARLVTGAGVPVGDEFLIAFDSTANRTDVDVAYNAVRDEYLVVYTNHWDSGLVDVAATRVRATDGALLGSAIVATGSDGDRDGIHPAHLPNRDEYLLVFEFEDAAENEEVHAKLTAGDLSGVGAAPELVLASGLGDHVAPVVAAHNGEYLVAWTYWDDAWPHVTTEIRARRFDVDGTPLGPPGGFLVDEFLGASGIQTRQVRFAGDLGFFIGWYYNDPMCPTGGDQHGRFVELGADEAVHLEFPTVSTTNSDGAGFVACSASGQCMVLIEDFDGVDAHFATAWRAHTDDFEDGTFDAWTVVVGASP